MMSVVTFFNSRVTGRRQTPFLVQGVTALCLCLLSTAGWSQIYRWVDENGQVHFSDAIPPEVSKLERHVLDQHGNLREVLRRQRTVEELEAHRRRMDAMDTERDRRAQQDEYDRYLWTTFESLDALEKLRDDRLSVRDQQIELLNKDMQKIERELTRERSRRTERPLAQQNTIRALESDSAAIAAKIAEIKRQRQSEFEGLNKDMARYEYLRLRRAVGG